MNFGLLALEFAPLLIYLMVDYWKGFRAGIYAAIITSVMVIAYDFYLSGDLDKFILGEAVLITVLGSISLKMNNDRYFKFQPSVVALVFAGIFAYFQWFDQPLLLHSLPHMEKLLESPDGANAELLMNLHQPKMQATFTALSGASVWLFLGHGLIMAYAALRLSTRAWFGLRLAIYPAMLVMVIYFQIVAA